MYAFCGEGSSIEKYSIKENRWEMLPDPKLPNQFYGRFGIRCLPMWDLPEDLREKNKVIIFGGEQEEIKVYDIEHNSVEFMKKSSNVIRNVLGMDNNLKMGGKGHFHN